MKDWKAWHPNFYLDGTNDIHHNDLFLRYGSDGPGCLAARPRSLSFASLVPDIGERSEEHDGVIHGDWRQELKDVVPNGLVTGTIGIVRLTVEWFLTRKNDRWLGWNTDCKYRSEDTHARWKIKWRLELLGALRIKGETARFRQLRLARE